MSIFSIIVIIIVSCLIQVLTSNKANKKIIKFSPLLISLIGVFAGICIHEVARISYELNIVSKSVMSENQYFAIFISIPFIASLIGCLIGVVLSTIKDKMKLFYFMPFILFMIVYSTMTFLGFGLISLKEVAWLVLYFVSGLLLSKGVIWGGAFGLIPSIVFVYMSTQYTGQVVDIELPLGLVIAAYYLGCTLWLWRNRVK